MAECNFCPNCFAPGLYERCPGCGYTPLSQTGNHLILPTGELLGGRYLVGRTLGAGGFGVTYLVKDQEKNRLSAVKEYLPATLAARDPVSRSVYPSSADNEDAFRHGLSVFKREAGALRSFAGNPSIVEVYDYFEESGTAYFVMEYLDGVNLRALMRSMGGKVPPALAMEVLERTARTLDEVHQRGLLHRDVSPENIFLTKGGDTKLIDFGATRFFVGEKSQSLSVILKPGFAPPEQYSSRGNQGPWTDLYALCATFLYAMSGQTLPDAPDRLGGAGLPPLAGVSPVLAAAVEKGLALDYRARQQSMGEFLGGIASVLTPAPVSSPARIEDPARLRGNPYIRSLRTDRPGDKWLIPRNLPVRIGRAAEQCNIVLGLPSVSRVHCTIQYDDKRGVFTLTDLSTNGTLAGTERIPKGEPRALKPGDRFSVSKPENLFEVGLE